MKRRANSSDLLFLLLLLAVGYWAYKNGYLSNLTQHTTPATTHSPNIKLLHPDTGDKAVFEGGGYFKDQKTVIPIEVEVYNIKPGDRVLMSFYKTANGQFFFDKIAILKGDLGTKIAEGLHGDTLNIPSQDVVKEFNINTAMNYIPIDFNFNYLNKLGLCNASFTTKATNTTPATTYYDCTLSLVVTTEKKWSLITGEKMDFRFKIRLLTADGQEYTISKELLIDSRGIVDAIKDVFF
ncbi:hypothetical protein [Thermococcus henrietii]|uniref:hypothetical protein n=1 Tax=Thermococcus henrietii TaxID=2016361 RepID=UPI0011AB8BE2|nr:hypothetical protein [Thermococcus henrietii]